VEVAKEFCDKWLNTSPLITPSIFCHSPYTCSGKTIKKAKQAAKKRELIFQIHAAETKREWDHIFTRCGKTPIKYLDDLGILDKNTLLVHTIWLDENDIEIIAKQNVKISHNPESNMKLASGIAKIPEMLKKGITVGLGTDGSSSNNNLDFFSEMNTAAKLHKVNTMDPTIMNAKTVLKMGTIEGAKTLGIENQIGSIETGKKADIIIIDTKKPHLIPMYNPVSHIVYSVKGSDVRDVFVSGRTVVENGKLLTLDLYEIYKMVEDIKTSISG
jgi:5-methylthioadenosine/S-adenosylhomocysteine deaminase